MAEPFGKDKVSFTLAEEARLRSERSLDEAAWQAIRRYVYPESSQIQLDQQANPTTRDEILDNTAEDACDMAAAGLHGLLTNPATQWIHFSLPDSGLAEQDGPSRWLEEAARRTSNLFAYAPSKFNVASFTCYTDAVALANWCMFVEERPGNMPLFRAVSVGEGVWDVDDDDDVVRFFRKFRRPLWAVHKKFNGRLPPRLAKLHEKTENWSKLVTLLHAVEPRDVYNREIANARNMPFSSCWIDVDGQELIWEGGYHEMPYICGRWRMTAGRLYARGCGHKALPDSAMLQRGTRGLLQATEVITKPPMLVPDEGLRKRLNLRGAAANYIRRDMIGRKEIPQPLLTGGRVDITEEVLAGVRDRIKRAFMKDLLQLIRDPEATATQVLELKEEQMRGMSPVLASITQGWLSPLVLRAFSCAQRAGAFRDMPPPREIVGLSPTPVFVSPAARAQQMAEARGVAQAFEATGPITALEPDTADNADLDKAYRLVFKAVGTPLSVLRSPEDMAKRREGRAQQRQQMQNEETLKNVTTGLKNATPALKLATEQQQAA